MRILVTGATGYVGSRLVSALLADDHQVVAASRNLPRPVNALADPHHLADTDPAWAGGDVLRIRRLARAVTPPIARPP